jgi:hypothetical protein
MIAVHNLFLKRRLRLCFPDQSRGNRDFLCLNYDCVIYTFNGCEVVQIAENACIFGKRAGKTKNNFAFPTVLWYNNMG